jgi:lipopolysaccharide export system permease protein
VLKRIDIYIIKKFLGTYFLALIMIICIAVIFDFSEKMDNFMEKDAPVSAIIFDYYFNFIPYFANMFSPLFTFISVIFFTSKMAYNTEIISILAGGISFRRFVRPYMISAFLIASLSFVLHSYVIPPSNFKRLMFEDTYYRDRKVIQTGRAHIEIEPGVLITARGYNEKNKTILNVMLDKFDDKTLISRFEAESGTYNDSTGKWTFKNYTIREIAEWEEHIVSGASIDTTINLRIEDFETYQRYFETLTTPELTQYIDEQQSRGLGNLQEYIIEKHNRYANPFSAFILTIIGVSISSHKVRGGTGLHIGLGLMLSFSYILFSTIINVVAINGRIDIMFAVWLPNIVYFFIALYLYWRAPK